MPEGSKWNTEVVASEEVGQSDLCWPAKGLLLVSTEDA